MNRDLTNVIGYIYKITSPNGKIYIGQTLNIKSRKNDYKNGHFKKQTKLWNNCQKYNWNPLDTFEVIEECLCGEDKCFLNEKEIYWISYYDSFNNGLNCTQGGKGQVGRIWTEKEKEKQREIALSKPLSEQQKINHKIACDNRKGYKHTEESKEKMSLNLKGTKSRTGLKNSEQHNNLISIKNSKKCMCIETGIIYNSISEAEYLLGLTHISSVCSGKRKKAGGFTFKII